MNPGASPLVADLRAHVLSVKWRIALRPQATAGDRTLGDVRHDHHVVMKHAGTQGKSGSAVGFCPAVGGTLLSLWELAGGGAVSPGGGVLENTTTDQLTHLPMRRR